MLQSMLLLCIGLCMSLPVSAQLKQVTQLKSGTYYRIKTGNHNSGQTAQQTPYLADVAGVVKTQALNITSGDADAQLWLVKAVAGKSDYYTVQNKQTQKYLQGTNDNASQITTVDAATEVYVPKNTKTGDARTWFNIMTSASAAYSYNWRGDNTVRGWQPNDGGTTGLTGSEWGFVYDYTETEIDEELAALGQVRPEAGDKVYRIFNYSSKFATNTLYEYNGMLGSVTDGTETDAQYWQLIDQGDGTMALQNLMTGHYVQSLNGTKNVQYQMGTQPYGFSIGMNMKVFATGYAYDIADTESGGSMLGLNCTDKPNGAIYSWTSCDGTNDFNSLWVFKPAELTDAQIATIKAKRANYVKDDYLTDLLQYGKMRIKSRRAVDASLKPYVTDITGLTTDDTSNGTCRMRNALTDASEANRQVWIAEKTSDGGYTFRNYYTGKYLNYTNTGEARTFYIRYNPDNADSQYYVHLSDQNNFSDKGLHYQVYNDVVMGWNVNSDDYKGCDWLFEKVDDLTDDVVRNHFDAQNNRLTAVPDANQWVTLRDIYGTVMAENLATGQGDAATYNAAKFAQYWRFVPVEGKEGYYQLQNALTQHYMNAAAFNARNYVTANETDGGFKVAQVSSFSRFSTHFDITLNQQPTHALHSSQGRIVVWNSYASDRSSASVWSIEATNFTDDELTAARQEYLANNGELGNADTYNTALATFFTDAACTQLTSTYQSMTDNELKQAMNTAGLTSSVLQNMALKVKNNSWAKWEKIFRVRNIEPYTNPDTWNSILKIGYPYSYLSNPTGIWGKLNQLVYVFVGADIPEGSTINLRAVTKTDSQGNSTQLKKGLNIVRLDDASALYVHYEVATSDAANSKKWRDYPDIPVHIEGGEVDGYFDATRAGIDTDEAWQQMVKDGLFVKPFAMMKGTNVIYQMNCDSTKNIIPVKMREIVDFWDWMVGVQHSMMAVNEYKDRWRNMLGFYSVTYNYMFASSYGTYYNESTLGEILNYDKMSVGGGSLWGPAHEVGHNHQGLINMIGCTEISNNLFAQAVVHQNGRTSTRLQHRKFRDVANLYAAGTSWHDYNLWDRNTMYLKLYLYYEVAGHYPGFCSELFRQLRKDPLNHGRGSQTNPIPASEDFLKFAVKVSDIVKEDLSEFFQAYGFFVPFSTRVIGDYGDYYTVCTQEMIDAVKAHMKQYGKPKGNLLFIENHIKHEPAQDHDGNYLYDKSGNLILRKDFDTEDAVGKCGDVGSYSDFTAGHYASGYTYTRRDSTITMKGEGAVGYKVYDNEGNLLYFANTNTFTLPQSVVKALAADGKSMVVKVAQPDGTDVTLPAPGATTYTLKVYHADALSDDKSNTVYTDGTAATLPTLEGNALAYIQPTPNALPATLTEAANIVDAATATAQNVVITDKADFYAPTDFTAATLTYNRQNTAGYNSVCLPFATEPADFGTEAIIEQFSALTTGTDGAEALQFIAANGEQPAGQPCLVYCPDDVTEWQITKHDAAVVANPLNTSAAEGTLTGSFVNGTIGAGKYKLNASGTAFGVTTPAGRVTAFRCYYAPSAAASQRALQVIHADGTVTAVPGAPAGTPTTPVTIHDLSGRRISTPATPGLYIMNGKKVIIK